MQRKVVLFLMFLLSISNNAFSLDMRRSEAFFEKEASNLSPNIATFSDIVSEQPNEAFIPNDGYTIDYDIAPEGEDIAKAEVLPVLKVIDSLDSSKDIDLNKTLPIKKSHKSRKSKPVDRFPDINVSEGEEVLVSSSAPTTSSALVVAQKDSLATITPLKPEEKNIAVSEFSDISPLLPAEKFEEKTKVDDNPFGVIVSKTKDRQAKNKTVDIAKVSPFVRAFSAIKPEPKKTSQKPATVKSSKKKKSSIASSEALKKDLHRAYLSGNQYLSAYEDEDDENEEEFEEDVDEELSEDSEKYEEEYADDAGFKSQKNVNDALEGKGDKKPPVNEVNVKEVQEKLSATKKSVALPSGSLKVGNREVLQMKIDFQSGSSAISGESVNLIRSFAQIATEQPTNSIEIAISENVMGDPNMKKLTARRLSIISNILRNSGISDRQIHPVLSNRDDNSFAFSVVGNDPYTRLRISKGTDIFGEEENVKEYDIMKW